MKRLFTLAVIALTASLTFAQAPLAKKSALSANRLERMANVEEIAKAAKETKVLEAAKAEKAAAAKETGRSVLRKGSANRGFAMQTAEVVVNNWTSAPTNFRKALVAKPFNAIVSNATTQEGNVTVTTDEHGIITDVTGVEPKMYSRATSGTAYYLNNGSMYLADQSGTVSIVEDGDNVYIKNPITRYTVGSWVKGTKSGNIITVAAGQPLYYNSSASATSNLRWGAITSAGSITVDDSHAEAFTFTVDGNVLTLEGTAAFGTVSGDAYYMGAFWSHNNGATGYGDAETVLTYDDSYVPPSTELVVLPTGAQATGWYMNAGTVDDNQVEVAVNNQNVNVAFFDNDVYVQGISPSFPNAWVKGTIDGTTVKFDKFQYVGKYGTYDCWFTGVNPQTGEMKVATATYDAEAKTLTFADDILINASATEIFYLDWFFDVVLSEEEAVIEEPVITTLTTELPYLNTFDTDEEQAEVAIYDANDDASTFSFNKHSTTGSMTARLRYNTTNAADDYLVFPGMELKAGMTYKISLDAAAYGSNYPERLEVVAGKEAKVSQLTIPVIPATVVDTKDFNTLSNGEFTVEEDGTYYIAVHAISDANMFYLYVDNFSVAALDNEAPVAVSDLAAVADAEGANKATVTFTVPAETLAGGSITDALTVTVKRDGETVWAETKAAGEAVSLVDETPAAGYVVYAVTTAYNNHVSDAAEIKVYVGYDTPAAVTNVTVADKSGAVALAWDAPEGGAEGYIVNPADYKYNIYPVEFMSFLGMTFPVTDFENPYLTGVTETSATVEYDTNEGDHGFTYFAVTAENTTGESEDTYGAVVTGAPYDMPVFESCAGGSLSFWWGYAQDRNNNSLEGGLYIGENASDEDGYCFELLAKTRGYVELQSGKIALAGAANPMLTLDYAADNSMPLTVTIITPNGANEVATLPAEAEYAPAEISLLPFANEDWVRVIIKGEFAAAGSAYVDNIRVYNMLDNNLVAGAIKATSSVQAGEDVTVTVTVENQGASAVAEGAYTVALYCNDAKVQTLAGVALAKNAKTTFEFTEATNVMTPSELVWKAVVEFADDNDQANNTTGTAKTIIKTPNYPVVADLAGALEENTVTLTWSEPVLEGGVAAAVTDDFESYEGFTTFAGDWTFVDVDASKVGGFQNKDLYVNGENIIGSYQSFWVQDVTDGATWNTTFAAHSGSKYLAAMFRSDDGQVDDWAISPMLCGDAQTISFYARSYSSDYPEKIEVLYSTGSTDVADFISVRAAEVVPNEWTEYIVELPEGAKYFAIRSCAASSFMLMVDDVTYTPASSNIELALEGYNVYRDGAKLNAALLTETAYTDANVADGEHNYAVTVVYDKGESAISNVVTVSVATGINGMAAKSATISAANKMITVTNAAGENVSICTIDGKVVYNAVASDAVSVPVEGGLYVVKVGKAVVKAIVK